MNESKNKVIFGSNHGMKTKGCFYCFSYKSLKTEKRKQNSSLIIQKKKFSDKIGP